MAYIASNPMPARGSREFTFDGHGQTNVHAVKCAGGFVWMGYCQNPSVLLRFDPRTGATMSVCFKEEKGLHDLAYDGRHLWVLHSSGHLSRVDIQICSVTSRRIELSSGQNPFLYCLHFDGRHLWAGTYTDPGCLLRIDRETESQDEFRIDVAPKWSVRTVVTTDDSVWVGLYTVPGMVVIIDRKTGQQRVLDLGEANKLCTSSAYDGNAVWVGLDTRPARVLRIDARTHEIAAHDFHEGSSCVRALAYDGRQLWIGLYTEPGELLSFEPQSKKVERHIMPPSFFNVRDLSLDGSYIWLATQNVRYKPSGLYGWPLAAGVAQ
jgi:streptogramin lyase